VLKEIIAIKSLRLVTGKSRACENPKNGKEMIHKKGEIIRKTQMVASTRNKSLDPKKIPSRNFFKNPFGYSKTDFPKQKIIKTEVPPIMVINVNQDISFYNNVVNFPTYVSQVFRVGPESNIREKKVGRAGEGE
jgi:hypothetical protein